MIFNDAMPLIVAHMIIAAYVVGGFLVASIYAFASAATSERDDAAERHL